jgi:methylated-DNA-protein-cysteine methyltransferase-like protein
VSLKESAIYRVVRTIPRGRVATYGEVAELAGLSSGHRIVARAMRSCPEGLPWFRVVGKKDARRAQIAIGDADHAGLQRARLEREKVVFDENGFIPLGRFGWLHEKRPKSPSSSKPSEKTGAAGRSAGVTFARAKRRSRA